MRTLGHRTQCGSRHIVGHPDSPAADAIEFIEVYTKVAVGPIARVHLDPLSPHGFTDPPDFLASGFSITAEGEAAATTVSPACTLSRIVYMTTLPVADARAHLSRLVDEAERTHERFEITRNGHRMAVLLGAADFDALHETIAALADESLLADHITGTAEIRADDVLDADSLAEYLADKKTDDE